MTFTEPLKVGLVGTGYAASQRAKALQDSPRSVLLAVSGNSPENLATFCQTYSVPAVNSWQQLVNDSNLDLIVICTVNRDHGTIARAALEALKHVVVEYPLSLNLREAAALMSLAQKQNKLLHVEHIELLGGVHQAIRQYLPAIGKVFYARYSTITPQRPAPRRWTYHQELFGFPLTAAVSRIHRLTDLFGSVATVNCQARFWDAPESGYYTSCLCAAQLGFTNGLIADVIYGKGENFWQGDRTFELHGDEGTLIFAGEKGTLVRGEEITPIEVVPRRGLFVQDTEMVLDYLWEGKPLYVSPSASYYALLVADAARFAVTTGQTQVLDG
ncbi:MAG: Gfo/Idh/MocA family oxidoreductase [Gomphosphaeria aponina SAG 52.96 = DSM 107014]|uniref:Gfo/Idh/MocA family oxidoreductase n=1 Tax=Gomphosphaeria aponina SAG 52.96 = DSM 107014 TaxID=1521640 RepID=A0A941GN26_9CHRO|nr:Gfo/Idh/MocA family oxidoreductase [Gomphosphaeria aponina SAG 52.96 = DSM 107014]